MDSKEEILKRLYSREPNRFSCSVSDIETEEASSIDELPSADLALANPIAHVVVNEAPIRSTNPSATNPSESVSARAEPRQPLSLAAAAAAPRQRPSHGATAPQYPSHGAAALQYPSHGAAPQLYTYPAAQLYAYAAPQQPIFYAVPMQQSFPSLLPQAHLPQQQQPRAHIPQQQRIYGPNELERRSGSEARRSHTAESSMDEHLSDSMASMWLNKGKKAHGSHSGANHTAESSLDEYSSDSRRHTQIVKNAPSSGSEARGAYTGASSMDERLSDTTSGKQKRKSKTRHSPPRKPIQGSNTMVVYHPELPNFLKTHKATLTRNWLLTEAQLIEIGSNDVYLMKLKALLFHKEQLKYIRRTDRGSILAALTPEGLMHLLRQENGHEYLNDFMRFIEIFSQEPFAFTSEETYEMVLHFRGALNTIHSTWQRIKEINPDLNLDASFLLTFKTVRNTDLIALLEHLAGVRTALSKALLIKIVSSCTNIGARLEFSSAEKDALSRLEPAQIEKILMTKNVHHISRIFESYQNLQARNPHRMFTQSDSEQAPVAESVAEPVAEPVAVAPAPAPGLFRARLQRVVHVVAQQPTRRKSF